jgi:hypothetical protein
MEFKIKDNKIVNPKGFEEQPFSSKQIPTWELCEMINIALENYEDKAKILYCEDTGVQESCVEKGNLNVEVIENEKEILVSIYELKNRWIKTKGVEKNESE